MRHDHRQPDQLRPIRVHRGFTGAAGGSVLIEAGHTKVLCTASLEEQVPPWMAGQGRGWITAEYGMLPGSTSPRKKRERDKIDGRSTEIQRLIGRSLRAVADLEQLGERMITVDCDVLQADGGTRTASITGALIALVDCLAAVSTQERPDSHVFPLRTSVAAVSVGLVEGRPVLDLDYTEDAAATVDMNVVMTGTGQFVEIQGTGEEATFSQSQLLEMLDLARSGIEQLTAIQRDALGDRWPFE
ncbi:MAG: ribonuclease PH [Planctomycetaceae bacterium]|nr:ribonuclease PH [Planctomycetaceae bacterium]